MNSKLNAYTLYQDLLHMLPAFAKITNFSPRLLSDFLNTDDYTLQNNRIYICAYCEENIGTYTILNQVTLCPDCYNFVKQVFDNLMEQQQVLDSIYRQIRQFQHEIKRSRKPPRVFNDPTKLGLRWKRGETCCQVCGETEVGNIAFLEAHHIIPKSHGGSNAIDNLVLLCPRCHKLVHRLIKIHDCDYDYEYAVMEAKELLCLK